MPLKDAEAHGENFFRQAGIKDLSQAQEMDASVLMEKLRAISPDWRFGFGQCIDGKFVKESVWDAYYNDRLPDVPMIVGLCWDETQGGLFAGKRFTYADFLKWAESYGDDKEEFLRIAGVTNDSEADALTRTEARNMLLSGSRGFCELRSEKGQKVYY